MTYHRVCNWSNTTGVTSGSGTSYPSGAHTVVLSTPCLSRIRTYNISGDMHWLHS